MVHFAPNVDVRVYAKAETAWLIDVQGRRGWAPLNSLRETRIHVNSKDLVEVHAAVEKAAEEVAAVNVTVDKKEADKVHVEQKQPEPEPDEEKPVYEYSYEYVKDEQADAPANENVEVGASEQIVASGAMVAEQNATVDAVATEQSAIASDDPGQTEKATEEEEDEDDLLEMKPVDEPLAIKKDVYKVGQQIILGEEPTGENANVKLEMIGFPSNTSADNTDKDGQAEVDDNSDSSYVDSSLMDKNAEQSTAPILEKVDTTQGTQPVNQTEKIPEAAIPSDDKIESVPIDNVEVPAIVNEEPPVEVEAEAKQEFTETVLPSTTNKLGAPETSQKPTETVTPLPDIQPSFAAQKTVISGTTLPDLERDPILTTTSDIKPTETEELKTATVAPTPIVQHNDPSSLETPKLDVEQLTTTLDDKTQQAHGPKVDATVYDSDYLHTAASTVAESHANHIDATAIFRQPEELTEAPVTEELSKAANLFENPAPHQPSQVPPAPENEVLPDQREEPVEPEYPAKQNEPLAKILSESTSDELKEVPTEAEVPKEPFAIESQGTYNVEEVVRADEQSGAIDTDDIFSPNYVPKSEPATQPPSDATIVDDSSWYDGILLALENVYSSIAPLSALSTAASEPSHETTPDAPHGVDADDDGYCERLDGNACPKTGKIVPTNHYHEAIVQVNFTRFVNDFLSKVVEMANLVMCLSIAGACILLFLFGQQYLVGRSRESELIGNLNDIERKLLTSQKECDIVTADLLETRDRLSRIADKSFGVDDMIKQCAAEKIELQAQIETLEKELETSVEAGLELNKMVSDLLNNQSGSDSLINSVEELQKQLNEQEAATVYINNLLAEKSRENSELQILMSESNSKFGAEIDKLAKENEELRAESEAVESELKDSLEHLQLQLSTDLEEKTAALGSKAQQLEDLQTKYEEIVSRWQISVARADAYEDSLTKLKQLDGKEDVRTVIEITNVNAKLLATEKVNETLKEKIEADSYAQSRLDEQIKSLTNEINRLRADFMQNEKDKLEAQTRLEVLSSYFKEKEAQLQK